MREKKYPDNMIKMVEKIENLPSLPEVAHTILSLINDPDSTSRDLTNVIIRDPAIASQLLKLVNSAYYGLSEKISDINRAITLVGFNRLKDLALSASFLKVFNVKEIKGYLDIKSFWKHCVISAGISQEIMKIKDSKHQIEAAYAVGLLHDIGLLVMLEHCKEEIDIIIKDTKNKGLPLYTVEESTLGFSHADVGAWLCEKWKLPEEIRDGIHYHHMPEKYSMSDLAGAVDVANSICRKIGIVYIGEKPEEIYISSNTWQLLGLDEEALFSLYARAERENTFAEIILME